MTRALLLIGLLLGGVGCAAVAPAPPAPTRAPGWVLFTMDQQAGGGYGEYLWKPKGAAQSAEACRAQVRELAARGPLAPVGLIAWYPLPGQPTHWVGCLPEGYDPYERR